MRWLRRLGLALVVLAVLMVAWEPTRVGLQTAVMLPNLIGAGPRVLDLLSEAPRREAVPYRTVAGADAPELAELWLPSWASADRRAGAMLLVLGVNNVGRNHPVVKRVADALARTGVAVLVPDSAVLLDGRLEVGEVDGVVRAYETLTTRPEVDPDRVGIVGFSVGGSLALLAAGDPRIAHDVRWVNAFGAFADAETYLSAVAAHAYVGPDGEDVPWTPTPLARQVYLDFVLDQARSSSDRSALRLAFEAPILAGERPPADPELREDLDSAGAQAIHDLLSAGSRAEAEAAIRSLTGRTTAFVRAVSPVHGAGAVRADVYLMHEVEDHHVPYVETRRLADVFTSTGTLRAHTEFRLFDHVQPDDLDLVAAAPELVKLLLHVRALMEASL